MTRRRIVKCNPPVDNSVDVKQYLKGLRQDERVVECGQSALTGCFGKVYLNKQSVVCVEWEIPGETYKMVTSVTWGARRVTDVEFQDE